jgi:hypothetical protein
MFAASLAYTSILKIEEQKSSTINKKNISFEMTVHLHKVYLLAIIATSIKHTAELLSNIWKVFEETIYLKLNHTDAVIYKTYNFTPYLFNTCITGGQV